MVPYRPPGQDYAQFIGIYDRMARDRILFIGNYIDEEQANSIISTILYLRKEDSEGPITLYLNVPGALLRPGLAVYDLLCQIRKDCEITTVNIGLCTGMGALLAGAGTKGRRCALPNSRFLLQRIGMDTVFQGQATDIALEVRNVKKCNDRLDLELSRMTGHAAGKCREDMKRDFYLSADEAVRYGLIDRVLQPAPRKRATQGQDTDLGAFEGEDQQRYQNQEDQQKGGWGGKSPRDEGDDDDDDDDGPKILKG
jgi:ATP-dependent Clp protease protease subunit